MAAPAVVELLQVQQAATRAASAAEKPSDLDYQAGLAGAVAAPACLRQLWLTGCVLPAAVQAEFRGAQLPAAGSASRQALAEHSGVLRGTLGARTPTLTPAKQHMRASDGPGTCQHRVRCQRCPGGAGVAAGRALRGHRCGTGRHTCAGEAAEAGWRDVWGCSSPGGTSAHVHDP